MVSDLACHAGDSMDFNGIVGWKPRKNASNIGGTWQMFPEETYSNGKIKATRTVVWSVLKYWMVGWMVERLTAVVVVHRHNLRQQISGSAPETSLLPSPPATGGLLEQKQEQERKDAKQKKTPNNPKKEPLTN